MSEWKPLKDAPLDTVFLASDDAGLLGLCFISEDQERSHIRKRWFGRDKKIIDSEAGQYIYFALPRSGASYARLVMRTDTYHPKWWMSLDSIPNVPE